MTGEKQDEVLMDIHSKVSIILERQEEQGRDIKGHDKVLHGNGKDGIILKVDRLETFAKTERWVYGIIFVVFFGILAKALYMRLSV